MTGNGFHFGGAILSWSVSKLAWVCCIEHQVPHCEGECLGVYPPPVDNLVIKCCDQMLC